MRKALIIVILAAAAPVLLHAQTGFSAYPNPELAEAISKSHPIASLNACPYDLAVTPGPDTRAPRGYKPFYISHYGRHGTRSGWDQGRYEFLISTLQAAKDEGMLSGKGDSLLCETRIISDACNGMEGRLTRRGQIEHREIAGRMYKRFHRVFHRGNRQIRVISSTVPRCLVSMASFTNRLQTLDPKLSISMDCGERIQKEVTNGAPAELRDASRPVMDSMWNAMSADYGAMIRPLFASEEAAARLVPDQRRFADALFGTARTSFSFDVPFDLYRYVPLDVMYTFMEYYNIRMYLMQCNSLAYGDMRMKTAVPLWQNIVRCAEEAIAGNGPAADLRFGHDYPLLALCSMMGLQGIGERYTLEQARRQFFTTDYSPFAGNLQLVFYCSRKAGKPVLVKILLNENETRIPGLEPVCGPFYKWKELRDSVLAKNY